MVALFAVAAAAATLLGGLFALRLRDRLHLILGFSAGAVLGVALFDLIPESLELAGAAHGSRLVLTYVAVGFALYLIIERFVALHSHSHEEDFAHHRTGVLGVGALSIHSLLDGIAIGLAFQASAAVGIVIGLAVLAHDFSDGINTVSMVLRRGGARSAALRWLTLDAVAPVIGILLSFLISVSDDILGLLLALFAGFFLYIGASDLLPESHHRHPVYWTTIASVGGMALMYAVLRLAA